MATFLTTSRMNPALAERIEASVKGRRGRPGASRRTRRLSSVLRLLAVLGVALSVYQLVASRRQRRVELEQARATLLARVDAQASSVAPDDRRAVERATLWLARVAGPYEGDLVDDELKVPGALATTLKRPVVYVRGSIDALASTTLLPGAAATSFKDPLVLCLLEPPASRSETALLDKVRIAYAGGMTMESHTANVRRLSDALVGLPLLEPAWSARVRAAEDEAELSRLRRELDRAPIEQAKQAAAAGLFVIAMDEPGAPEGTTELDGERPHPIRMAIVDLVRGKPLLRARRAVDPSWITTARRPTYARGLDGCAFSYDVHQALEAPRR